MAPKKSALGQGVDALFLGETWQPEDSVTENQTLTVRLTHIEPNRNQPRRDFNKETLSELADSILKHGMIQPLVVRKQLSGYYRIIAGERRWRAAKMAGLDEVPVIVKDVDDMTASEMTLVENLQREDLNPVEEAVGYKYLIEQYDLTQDELAKKVVKSRSVIANSLRLLALPEELLDMLRRGDISTGHARALIPIADEEQQKQLADRIVSHGLSVREVENLVRELLNRPAAPPAAPPEPEADRSHEEIYYERLQHRLSEVLGTDIKISRSKGREAQRGKLEIIFKNNDHFEDILRIIGGEDIFT